MRSLLIALIFMPAFHAHTTTCDVTGHYRCKNGRTGSVVGRGQNLDLAKIAARDRAREICGGMVDYVRFVENTSHC